MKAKQMISITICLLLLGSTLMATTVVALNKPFKPQGPKAGAPNVPLTYRTYTTHTPNDEDIYFKMQYGPNYQNPAYETDWYGPVHSLEHIFIDVTFVDYGSNYVFAVARSDPDGDGPDDDDGVTSQRSSGQRVVISDPPLAPIISMSGQGELLIPVQIEITAVDPDTDFLEPRVDFGEGDGWTDWGDSQIFGTPQIANGDSIVIQHTYTGNGRFELRFQTRETEDFGLEGWHPGSESPIVEKTLLIGAIPPEAPTIEGDTIGYPGQPLEFTATTTDEEGDDVRYLFDWGDGTDSYWIPYEGVPSGESFTTTHEYEEYGDYNVKVKATDEWGNIGNWSENHSVHIRSVQILGLIGGFNPGFTVQNLAGYARDVEYTVEFVGGSVPGFHFFKERSGNVEALGAGETATITLGGPVFGLGNFDVKITLDVSGEPVFTEVQEAFILFAYVMV
jgi:hypothetical protein